jgi:hypothetical protein
MISFDLFRIICTREHERSYDGIYEERMQISSLANLQPPVADSNENCALNSPEASKGFVVSHKLTLSLKHINFDACLAISSCGKDLQTMTQLSIKDCLFPIDHF